MKFLSKYSIIALIPSLCLSEAHAQGIEEIVVTATKRGEVSVQDIAGGITAITGDTIDKHDLRSLEDFSRLEPGLQYATQGVGDTQLIIRGISSPGDSTVGVYFDESPITGGNFQDGGGRTPDIGAYDIARIEVLKGPQGTLFGASSMSGAVRIITNKPDASAFDMNVSAGFESTEHGDEGYSVNAAVNVPLIADTLALRLVGWQKEQGGYIDQYAGLNAPTELKDVNDSEITGGRIMARLTPNENLTIDAFYQMQETEVDGAQHYAPIASGLLTPTQVIVVPFPHFIPAFDGTFGDLKTSTAHQEPYGDDIDMYGITIDYDLGFGSLLGSISKFERNVEFLEDTSATAMSFGFPPAFGPPLGSYGIHQFQDRDVFNAEIRFSSDLDGPVNFVGGFFYEDDETYSELDILAGDIVTGIPVCRSRDECITDPALAGASLAFARSQDIDFEFFAVFGHVDFEVTEQITLGGGVRYFDSEQDNLEQTLQAFQGSIAFTIPPLFGGPIQTTPTVTVDDVAKEDEITWDASLSFAPTDSQMYYVRAATGFRQGGINDASTASAFGISIPAAFTSDEVLSIEVGAKTSWNDDRITLNATYFKMFWDDMQVPGVEPTGAVEFISNAAEAEVDGVELELSARPTDQFLLHFGATWLNAELTEDQIVDPGLAAPGFTPPLGVDGDNIPKVPEWAFSGTMEYTFPFTMLDNTEASLRGNFSYTGESDTFFNNNFPGFVEIGDYFLLNLSANFQHGDWGLRFFVDNITDKRAKIDIDGSWGPDTYRLFTVRPRTFGAQLSWAFGQ
ncbi:MAG: TonB-dependent receptor [Gammaproteobacteria bacterium]|nr:TonB-dependent receptor [Gammaproteobacteria bacterium]